MRWDAVLQAIGDAATGDSALVGIFSTGIRMSGTHEWDVPSLEFMLVSATVNELWEPHVVQFSIFTTTMDDMASAERRLWRLFQHEDPVFIEGVYMWASHLDSADLDGPTREAYFARAVRFEFTPIRERLLAGRTT